MQGRIQDFRKFGSNLQSGVRFANFTLLFLKITIEKEIILTQSGVRTHSVSADVMNSTDKMSGLG